MKRFYTYITFLVMLISIVITAGCSAGKLAVAQTANDSPQVCTAPPSVNALPTQTPPAKTPATVMGSNWDVVLDMTITHPVNMVGFLDNNFGVTVGYAGEIHYSNDGGKTWPQAQNSSMCRFCLDIVDSQTIWSGGNGNHVRLSKDGGKTWTAVTDINLGGLHSNISFVDDTTGWVATLYKLASTSDGGKTWKEITRPEGSSGIAAISLRTPKDGYLLSPDGLLYITADGGATWSKQDLKLADLKIADIKKQPKLSKNTLAVADISFNDDKNGTVVLIGMLPGDGYRAWCLTTNDGGATWKSALIPKPSFLPSKLFLTKDGMYLTLSSSTNQTVVLKRK